MGQHLLVGKSGFGEYLGRARRGSKPLLDKQAFNRQFGSIRRFSCVPLSGSARNKSKSGHQHQSAGRSVQLQPQKKTWNRHVFQRAIKEKAFVADHLPPLRQP
jgi:hypothetical protein